MIRIAGRKEAPGRPYLYETTRDFLVAFGLRDVSDLPRVEGELVVPEPPAQSGENGHGDAEARLAATAESNAGTDAPQQDPGPGGAGVTPGR